MKQRLRRLERVASEMNAWLFALAIELAVLDFTVLVAKCMPPLAATPTTIASDKSAPVVAQTPSLKASEAQ